MRIPKRVLGLLALLAVAVLTGAGDEIWKWLVRESRLAGAATVSDGDSLVVNGERVRLAGIDAPELAQTCERADGGAFSCGQAAKRHLRELIRKGGSVTCQGRAHDRYGRLVATCRAGETDLGAAMVRDGWAIAAGSYSREEAAARAAKTGLWAGSFEAPGEFRKKHPRADMVDLGGDEE